MWKFVKMPAGGIDADRNTRYTNIQSSLSNLSLSVAGLLVPVMREIHVWEFRDGRRSPSVQVAGSPRKVTRVEGRLACHLRRPPFT